MENTIDFNLNSNIETLRSYHIIDGNGKTLYRGCLEDTYKVWKANTQDEDFFKIEFPNENYSEYQLNIQKENMPLLLMTVLECIGY